MPENPLWDALWKNPIKADPDFVDLPLVPLPSLPPLKPAIPHYPKGDTSAASARLAQLRALERREVHLRVPVALFPSNDALASHWKPARFRAVSGAVGALPSLPAASAPRLKESSPVRLPSTIGCRYPIGDPGTPNFRFCRAPRQSSSSYCECHHKLCYRGFSELVFS